MNFPFSYCTDINNLYNYDLLFDVIGHGKFSVVVKATRIYHKPPKFLAGVGVAIKIIQKKEITTNKLFESVLREVDILKKMDHPNCCSLVEVLQSTNEIYIVLPLFENYCDLSSFLYNTSIIPERLLAEIIKQILQGLFELHNNMKYVHRDIKLENILISPSALSNNDDAIPPIHIIIIDFGQSKYIGPTDRAFKNEVRRVLGKGEKTPSRQPQEASEAGVCLPVPSCQFPDEPNEVGNNSETSSRNSYASNITNTPVGTLSYLCPETIKQFISLNVSSTEYFCTSRNSLRKRDIWGVGIIMYILLSKRLPFKSKTKAQILHEIQKEIYLLNFDLTDNSSDSKKSCKNDRSQNINEPILLSTKAFNFLKNILAVNPNKRYNVSEALMDDWIRPMSLNIIPKTNFSSHATLGEVN